MIYLPLFMENDDANLKIATNNCPNCDPATYKIEGRTSSSNQWRVISEGDFPWTSGARNNKLGKPIKSTYSSADTKYEYTELNIVNTEAYLEYKLTFPKTRKAGTTMMYIGEIE